MIDVHTHILPELDDGSRSVEESRKMLKALLEQGVDTVVATPHFYIDGTTLESFFEEREVSQKKLTDSIPLNERPALAVGAEVQFFADMYTMENIEKLCISGTRYMLVEMPFSTWSGYLYKALNQLYVTKGITPIIAHVERYFEFQEEDSAEVIRRLKDANALIQINSSFLTFRGTRRNALKLVKKGLINFMGSDCHSIDYRPPEIRAGYDVIFKKMGESGVDAFAYWAEKLKEKIETV